MAFPPAAVEIPGVRYRAVPQECGRRVHQRIRPYPRRRGHNPRAVQEPFRLVHPGRRTMTVLPGHVFHRRRKERVPLRPRQPGPARERRTLLRRGQNVEVARQAAHNQPIDIRFRPVFLDSDEVAVQPQRGGGIFTLLQVSHFRWSGELAQFHVPCAVTPKASVTSRRNEASPSPRIPRLAG